jgi:hypothetical protein
MSECLVSSIFIVESIKFVWGWLVVRVSYNLSFIGTPVCAFTDPFSSFGCFSAGLARGVCGGGAAGGGWLGRKVLCCPKGLLVLLSKLSARYHTLSALPVHTSGHDAA